MFGPRGIRPDNVRYWTDQLPPFSREALGREAPGRGLAQTASRSRDNGYLIPQTHLVSRFRIERNRRPR